MKIGLKSILLFVLLLSFLAFFYYAISSGKITINNSKTSEVSTTQDEAEDEESEDTEVNENEISLDITSPKDGTLLTESPVFVKGITVAGADVFVNDVETKADSSGNFKVSLDLEEGENEVFVVVNDSEGNYAEGSVKITLNTE